MKKLGLVIIFVLWYDSMYSQVGIGTTTPSSSAILELKSSSKGFLPPRVALASTVDVATIVNPATGLMVYNTATAGSSPSRVTPGFYYYDGIKWQRLSILEPDATINFNTSNPNQSGTVFTPLIPNNQDYIYVSELDGSQWTFNTSTNQYLTYVSPSNSPFYLNKSTNDAGNNKSSAIYRTGSVAIGTNTSPDSSAILDANSTSKGFLPPRLTKAQRDAIVSPASGLLVYCTDCSGAGSGCLSQNSGSPSSPNWECVGATAAPTVVATCTDAGTGFGGAFMTGFPLSNAYYAVKISNNSFSTATLALSSADLILSGANGGITVTNVSLSIGGATVSSITLNAGDNRIIYYNLTGTPTVSGTIKALWSKLALNCTGSKTYSGLSGGVSSNYCTGATFNGNYVNSIALNSTNTFAITITNTSGGTISSIPAPTTSNLALSNSGTGTITVASVSPSTSFSLANGASQTIIYTLSGTPTSTGTLTGVWSFSDLNCTKTKNINRLDSFIDRKYFDSSQFNGSYVSAVAFTSSNTFTVTLMNNSSFALTNLPAPATSNLALIWPGSGSLSVTSVSPSASFSLAAGASQTITYTLSGTPTSSNTLSATWTYCNISVTKTRNIALGDATFSSSRTGYVFSVNDVVISPNIVQQGVLAIGTTIQMPYTGGFGSYIAYSSPFVSIPSQFCEDGANDWTFGYSYSAGTFSTSGNITVTLITRKAGVITAWPAKRVSSITTINFGVATLPWICNGNSYSPTIGLDEGGDAIRGAITQAGCASCSAYDAASAGTYVPVTSAEYNAMLNISGTVIGGRIDDPATYTSAQDAGSTIAATATTVTTPSNSSVTSFVPANNWIYAWCFKTGNAATGRSYNLMVGNAGGTTGFNILGNGITGVNNTLLEIKYFIIKGGVQVSSNRDIAATFQSFGQKAAAGTSHVSYFTFSPTTSNVTINTLWSAVAFYQALSTPIKQW